MLTTNEILDFIKKNVKSDLPIKFKNNETGETHNFECKYVAHEILFLFGEKDGIGTTKSYINQLIAESEDECWDSYIDNEDDSLSREEILDRKLDLIHGLETRIYVGDTYQCPIANFHQSFAIRECQLTEDALILSY